ncbi:probable protein phosphatase 2C 27 isoform X2 [Cynara cardunculus var. scolymus]|uniref:probable protein phosphatase 2C 27 isoform X2 n=1 Tax=Cynara cardunculus var. scolymus TaxID=59895 RepID=UPI000D628E93|nr:probable protein phosphatase 2C 27 isoform X2 [Cynara cardunculus var. scolymus]
MCVHDAVKDNLGVSADDSTAQLASDQITLSTSFPVFDGHGGKGASHFVRDHLPRIIVEDANFPLELEEVVMRSFMETDAAFAKSCSTERSLSSGTTALTAMIFGRSLLVANAGDCRAVLSRNGLAFEMSKDHRPCCHKERVRVESLGGFVEDGYLNGQLGVTRAIGNWHIKGLKESGEQVGPLSAEPELKLVTLTKEDEFLIIGSDGIWDVFRNQNAVDFIRRRLQDHNDVKRCCKDMVEEAMKRGAIDNLTVVVVCFQAEPPPPVVVQRGRVRRSISAEGLLNLKFHLEG